jgi:putative two-component system response regulator
MVLEILAPEETTSNNNNDILVVEDEPIVAEDIKIRLQGLGYDVLGTARSGKEAIKKAENLRPDLVLMDIVLEGEMDGIEAATRIRTCFDIPIVYVTAYADDKTLERAKITEPFGYILKPFEDRELHTTVAIALHKHRMETIINEKEEKLRKNFEDTVYALSSAVEMRDPYTAGHQERVSKLACAIAREVGFSSAQIEGLRLAGMIHDIGKIKVPQEILSKPGQLSAVDFSVIIIHPKVGFDILCNIDFPYPVAQIVLQHHERIDGSGYPAGLKDEDILPQAKVLAVADVVEAIASHRPYRAALGLNRALSEISKNKGVLFDPDAVEACLRLFREKGFKLGSNGKKHASSRIKQAK